MLEPWMCPRYTKRISETRENHTYEDGFLFFYPWIENRNEINVPPANGAKARTCKRHKARTHMYPVNHTPSRSENWCGLVSDSPKAFRARILVELNTVSSWIRCVSAGVTRRVAEAARTRETRDFWGRPASQTSEVQDGSRQPAINFKNQDGRRLTRH